MTDLELAEAIKQYMNTHKFVTRNELKKKLNTSHSRIERIGNEGLVTLPPKLSRSAGSTLGRKKLGIANNWYINKPPAWHTGA